MTRRVYRLSVEIARDACIAAVKKAPEDHVVTIAEPGRSLDQNAKMWPMLHDVARAKPEGRIMRADAWKAVFLDALGFDIEWVEGLEGRPPVPLGHRSSSLSKRQFSDLIEMIYEYGARHGVAWSEPNPYWWDEE